jgi:hypothetical protein
MINEITIPITGASTIKIAIFITPAKITESNPLPAIAAPTNPPTKVCDELDGRPIHQVIRFHVIALMEKYKITDVEISNLHKRLDKVIDFSQNTSKYWVSGSLNVKKTIQNVVFPDRLVLDTEKRQYLTSKVNSLFSLKREFMRTSGVIKGKLPIKNDEESYFVQGKDYFMIRFGVTAQRKSPASAFGVCSVFNLYPSTEQAQLGL